VKRVCTQDIIFLIIGINTWCNYCIFRFNFFNPPGADAQRLPSPYLQPVSIACGLKHSPVCSRVISEDGCSSAPDVLNVDGPKMLRKNFFCAELSQTSLPQILLAQFINLDLFLIPLQQESRPDLTTCLTLEYMRSGCLRSISLPWWIMGTTSLIIKLLTLCSAQCQTLKI
jgi:hypothetical protein